MHCSAAAVGVVPSNRKRIEREGGGFAGQRGDSMATCSCPKRFALHAETEREWLARSCLSILVLIKVLVYAYKVRGYMQIYYHWGFRMQVLTCDPGRWGKASWGNQALKYASR